MPSNPFEIFNRNMGEFNRRWREKEEKQKQELQRKQQQEKAAQQQSNVAVQTKPTTSPKKTDVDLSGISRTFAPDVSKTKPTVDLNNLPKGTNPEFAQKHPGFVKAVEPWVNFIDYLKGTDAGEFTGRLAQQANELRTFGASSIGQERITTGNEKADQVADLLGNTAGIFSGRGAMGASINSAVNQAGRAASKMQGGRQIAGAANTVANAASKAVQKIPNQNAQSLLQALGKGSTAAVKGNVIGGTISPNEEGNEKNFFERTGSSLRAGTGDVIENLGQTSKWLGAEETGETLIKSGQNVREGFEQERVPFSWEALVDPDFYSNSVARTVPFMASLMPVGVGGVLGGMKVAEGAAQLTKMGKTGTNIMKGLGAVAGGVPVAAVEAAMEAGQTFEQTGGNREAANEVFGKNLALLSATSGLEFALGFAPMRWLDKMGKIPSTAIRATGDAVMEGGQEGAQDYIQRDATGEEFAFDKTFWEQVAIGSILGGGMGAIGGLSQGASEVSMKKIRDKALEKLPEDLRNQIINAVEMEKQSGKSEQEALAEAFEGLGDSPAMQSAVLKATVEEVNEVAADLKEQAVTNPDSEIGQAYSQWANNQQESTQQQAQLPEQIDPQVTQEAQQQIQAPQAEIPAQIPAEQQSKASVPGNYGRFGKAAFAKDLKETGIVEGTTDYADFVNFFETNYNAGRNGQGMPETNIHPQQASAFYEAGQKDAEKLQQPKQQQPSQQTEVSGVKAGDRIRTKNGIEFTVIGVRSNGKLFDVTSDSGATTQVGIGGIAEVIGQSESQADPENTIATEGAKAEPKASTGGRIQYKVNKNHVAVTLNGKTYRFRHNDGFVTTRGSGLSVADIYDLTGADVAEEMRLDDFLGELDKAGTTTVENNAGQSPVQSEDSQPAKEQTGKTTVTQNNERKQVEIEFAGKPGQEVIDRLKANKFRYFNDKKTGRKFWYKKGMDEDDIRFANELIGQQPEEKQPEVNTPAAEEPKKQPQSKEQDIKDIQQDIDMIDETLEEKINSLAEELKKQVKDVSGDLLANRILERGGIKSPNGGRYQAEYNHEVPLRLKNGNGLPIDEMADELGMTVREMLDALSKKPSTDYRKMAENQLANDPGHRSLLETKQALIEGLNELTKPADAETKSPEQQIADRLKVFLREGKEFTSKDLFNVANEVYGGTQAQGKYSPKDAYDALELAVNQYLLEQNELDFSAREVQGIKIQIEKLAELTHKLPTQTKRTENQEKFQQFSTPPAIAYVASWLANIKQNDTVLEPSAGIGGLALFGKANRAEVIVNELDPRRLEIVKQMPFDRYFKEDGEQINNILPKDVQPSVVIMNPPFSTAANRGVKDTKNSFRHVEQALKRLQDGGRLVAILGQGRDGNSKQFNDWLTNLNKTYNVRASVGVDGKNYAKYGTSFNVQFLVIDKTEPKNETVTGYEKTLYDVVDKLEGVANDRQATVARSKTSEPSTGQSTSTKSPGENRKGKPDIPEGRKSGVSSPSDGVGRNGSRNQAQQDDGGRTDIPSDQDGGTGSKATDGGTDNISGRRSDDDQGNVSGETAGSSSEPVGQLDWEINKSGDSGSSKVKKELTDSVFEEYVPKKLKISGIKKHPGKLSESAAMSAVDPPNITYKPVLPESVIKDGKLSDAQIEAIAYAGQAHSGILPDGSRRGFFIGDGTGVGKGREISGIILDNMMQGRKKAVWVTENDGLLPSARRDWSDLGRDAKEVFETPKLGEPIKQKEGILFTKYGTIGSKLVQQADGRVGAAIGKSSRLDQIVEWVGKDFDGVIVFDEAHNLSNSLPQMGNRGIKKASQRGLAGIELQKRLPNARIVYVSATGATEVSNLAYAERLGLWGPLTAFANKDDFISKIESGGIAAMELVARDLKAMGLYISRSLSYNDVQYDKITHILTPQQEEVYDTLASSWQIVLQNIDEAMKAIGMSDNEGKTLNGRAKGRIIGQFWGAQQRFFNQVLTAMQMPAVIKEAKKDLAEGKAIVMQLVNTNEATQERGITKMEEEEGSLEDLDLSPRDIILQFIDRSFPVHQYETVVDEDGNETAQLVVDSQGNPVISAEAQAMKDELLAKLSTLRVPESPIEIILNEFGVENVAEITGRKRRVIEAINEETGRKERVIEKRSKHSGEADSNAFMDGKKNILIFSNAGGTGRSYHADLKAKNQKQRVHYLIQAGWEATKAVQGFGRTHRTNQKSAPVYKLFTTNLKGQMRFVSSIAKRLDQLGALTKGQRQTGSQGLFSASDNLEGWIAKDALKLFYKDLSKNQIPGLNKDEILTKMGIKDKILDKYGSFNDNAPEVSEVTKFLNRILVLESGLQNQVFEAFQSRIEDLTELAIKHGTLDTGLENLKTDTANIIEEKVIREDETGSNKTMYYQIEAGRKSIPVDIEKVMKNPDFIAVYRNSQSKAVKALMQRGSKTLSDGEIVTRYLMQGQEKNDWRIIDEKELEKSKWEKIEDTKEAMALWDEQLEKLPEFQTTNIHMISGTLLPIWDRLPQTKTRVVRVSLDNGDIVLGRIIPDNAIDNTLRKLGAERASKAIDIDSLPSKILEDGYTVTFANGWKLVKRRISGEWRIELLGDDLYKHGPFLKNIGVFTEKIAYRVRSFVPTDNNSSLVIQELNKQSPILEVIKYESDNTGTDTFIGPKNAADKKANKKTKRDKVTRTEILQHIGKEFRVPIGTGYYRKQALGIYKNHINEIRMKNFADFVVLTHELGHRLDKKFDFEFSENDAYTLEFEQLQENLDLPESMPQIKKRREAVAEFTRLYFFNPQEATELAPEFYQYFEMRLADAGLLEAMHELGDMLDTWTGQSARDRIRGVTDIKKDHNLPRLTKDQWYTKLFEDIHAIDVGVQELTGQKDLTGKDNPYKKAAVTRGTAGKIKSMFEQGIFDDNGHQMAKPLKEIFNMVPDINEFRDYLEALRAWELHERHGKYKTPISVRDAKKIVKESPEVYRRAAKQLYNFQNAVVDYVVKAGFFTEQQVKEMRDQHYFYIPFYRVVEELGKRESKKGQGDGSRLKRLANLASPIKKMKKAGSAKNIADPLESVIKNVFMFLSMADRNEAGRSLADLVDKTEDSAWLMAKVDQPSHAVQFSLEEVEKALKSAGFDTEDEAVDLEQIATVFRPIFMPSIKDRILTVWRDGKPAFYQVRDEDLYTALLNLEPEVMKLWVKLMSVPNNMLRTAITAAPGFIPKTFYRTYMTVLMQSDSMGVKEVITFPFDVARNLFHAVKGEFKGDKAYREFLESGAAMSTLLSIERDYLKEYEDKFLRGKMKERIKKEAKTLGVGAALKSLRFVLEKTDEAIKMTEFQNAMKKTGGDVVEAAYRAREADFDPARFGTDTKTLNMMSLFFNVALQGPDRTYRTFKSHPVRSIVRGSLYLTIPTLLLYLINHDDDEYWELPQWRRDMFWNIPMGNGKFFPVPIPFEWGLLFKTIPERFFRLIEEQDPDAFDGFVKTVYDSMVPSLVPTYMAPIIEIMTNKKFFNLAPVVPMSKEDEIKPEQYDMFTSETAKLLGEKLNISPIQVDHLVRGYLGTMGQHGLEIVDSVLGLTGMVDEPIKSDREKGILARTYSSTPYSGSSDSIDKFYKTLDREELKHKKVGVKGEPHEYLKGLRKIQVAMRDLRAMREDIALDREPFGKLDSKQKGKAIDMVNRSLVDLARYGINRKPLNQENLDETLVILGRYREKKK